MFKFFRKVRLQLLSKNNFSRYLLYAIGEILLVVVGILIALQVNNWNEDKKLQKELSETLQAIKVDLEMDLELMKKKVPIGKQKYKYWSTIIEKSDNDSLANRFILELGEPRPTINNANYTSAVSDNKLKLIRNRTLRSGLVSYYENDLKHFDAQVKTMANIHHLIMEKMYDESAKLKKIDNLADRIHEVLQDVSFQELVNSFVRMNEVLVTLQFQRIDMAEKLVQEIESELGSGN